LDFKDNKNYLPIDTGRLNGDPIDPPEDDDWPANGQIPLTYEPLPGIA